MKNLFSSSKSKRNHYNWFTGGDKWNPSKVTKYTLSEVDLLKLRSQQNKNSELNTNLKANQERESWLD